MCADQGGAVVKWCLIGSGMGSYLCARWAQLHPDRVSKLVLLSPAFQFPTVVERMLKQDGEDNTLATWQEKGMWSFFRGGLQVHYGLIEDYQQHPEQPDVPCPTLILHGLKDDIVPIEIARNYAAARDLVEMVELDDNHLLTKSMPDIVSRVSTFLGLEQALVPPPAPVSIVETNPAPVARPSARLRKPSARPSTRPSTRPGSKQGAMPYTRPGARPVGQLLLPTLLTTSVPVGQQIKRV